MRWCLKASAIHPIIYKTAGIRSPLPRKSDDMLSADLSTSGVIVIDGTVPPSVASAGVPLSCSTGTALLHRRGLQHCQKANDGYFIPLVLGSDVHPQAYAGHYVAFPMCMHDYGALRIIDMDR